MIRIVTDSSCDLPDEVIARHRIEIVPLTIRFGEEELIDREQLTSDEFWHRLTTGQVLPETAAPSVGRFQQAFTRLVSAGIPLRVIASGLVSAARGLAAIEAAEAAAAGGSIDEVEAAGRSACERGRIFATPDTLEYLRRGGRIRGAAPPTGGGAPRARAGCW